MKKKPKYLQFGNRKYMRMPKGTITPSTDTICVVAKDTTPKCTRHVANLDMLVHGFDAIVDEWMPGEMLALAIRDILVQARIIKQAISEAQYPDNVSEIPFATDTLAYSVDLITDLLGLIRAGEWDNASDKWVIDKANISGVRWQLIPGRPKLARAIDTYVQHVDKMMKKISVDDPMRGINYNAQNEPGSNEPNYGINTAYTTPETRPGNDTGELPAHVQPYPRNSEGLNRYYPKLLTNELNDQIFRPAVNALNSAAIIGGFIKECKDDSLDDLVMVFIYKPTSLPRFDIPIKNVADSIDHLLQMHNDGIKVIPESVMWLICSIISWLNDGKAGSDTQPFSIMKWLESEIPLRRTVASLLQYICELVYLLVFGSDEISHENSQYICDYVIAAVNHYPVLLQHEHSSHLITTQAAGAMSVSIAIGKMIDTNESLSDIREMFVAKGHELGLTESDLKTAAPLVVTCALVGITLQFYINLHSHRSPEAAWKLVKESVDRIKNDSVAQNPTTSDTVRSRLFDRLNEWEYHIGHFIETVKETFTAHVKLEDTEAATSRGERQPSTELREDASSKENCSKTDAGWARIAKMSGVPKKIQKIFNEIFERCIDFDNISISDNTVRELLPSGSMTAFIMPEISKIFGNTDAIRYLRS